MDGFISSKEASETFARYNYLMQVKESQTQNQVYFLNYVNINNA